MVSQDTSPVRNESSHSTTLLFNKINKLTLL